MKDFVKQHILTNSNSNGFGPPTPIISPGNIERYGMEIDLLKRFAKNTNQKVISWYIPGRFVGQTKSYVDSRAL